MNVQRTYAITLRKFATPLIILGIALGVSACKEEEIFTPEEVTNSENGTFTKSGRFFFAADLGVEGKNSTIMEITKEEGEYKKSVVLEGNFGGQSCSFNGLTSHKNTLYTVCTFMGQVPGQALPLPLSSLLIQVELDKDLDDPTRIQMTQLFGVASLPNGMAADKNGDLYITDSYSWLATYTAGISNPAIVKVDISNEDGFSITQTPWYNPGLDDGFPNGIRVQYNKVFFVSGTAIKRFPINKDGTAGSPTTVYTADACDLIDDFDITFNDYIVATQVGLNDAFFNSILWPGVDCTGHEVKGKLVGIYGKGDGKKLDEYVYENGTLPSSAVFAKGFLFEPNSVITTAYFTGGIQKVSTY